MFTYLVSRNPESFLTNNEVLAENAQEAAEEYVRTNYEYLDSPDSITVYVTSKYYDWKVRKFNVEIIKPFFVKCRAIEIK